MKPGAGIDRRAFLVRATATGGALALGFDIRFGTPRARAENGAPEVTAWIVIAPDDTVTIRVAKSEMGQGTFTALADADRRGARMRLEQGQGGVRPRA